MLRLFTLITTSFLLSACIWERSTQVQGYICQEPIYMASPYAGQLFSLDVHRGDRISAGQALFSLDPNPEAYEALAAEEQLHQAQATLTDMEKGSRDTVIAGYQAQVAAAEAALSISNITAERFDALYQKQAIDEETRDEAVADAQVKAADLAQAQANLDEAQLGQRIDEIRAQQSLVASLAADLEQAQWAVEQKALSAPMNATVLDTYFNPGEMIAANQPVLALLDPEKLYAVFYINEPLLSEICLGATIKVTHNAQGDKIPAEITYISPEAEYTPPVIYSRDNNQKLVFRIQATLPAAQAQSFHSGQPVDIYIPSNLACHDE